MGSELGRENRHLGRKNLQLVKDGRGMQINNSYITMVIKNDNFFCL